jgi:soluble lytic murein transglycosylase
MLKKLTPKTSLLAILSGTLLIALGGSVFLTPKIIEWVEQWQRNSQIAIEEEVNYPSVVLPLVSLSPEQRYTQLQAIASQEQPSLDRSRARYLLADALIKKYEGGPALKQLEGLELDYPILAPYILLKRGRAYELTNENDRANDTWKQLLEAYPDSLAIPEALYKLGKSEPAYWDQAIAKFPQHPRTWEIIQQRLKENPKQPELMLLLLKYNPFDPQMNAIRDRLVKDYAAQLTPENWQLIADGYWEQAEYQKAILAYTKTPPSAENAYRYARGLQIDQQKDQAKQAYQKLVRDFPKASETGLGLMRLVDLSGEKEALGYLDYVIKNFPEQTAAALLKKADILDNMGSQKSAAQARQRVLNNYPNSEAAAEYRWQVAQNYAHKGESLKAWQWAQPITVNNPDSSLAPKAAYWIGKWAQKLGRTQEAKDAFIHTVGRHPQSYYAWRSAVQLGWKVGDFNNVRFYAPTVVKPQERPLPPAGSKAFKEFYRLGLDQEAWDLFRAELPNPWTLGVDEQFNLALLKQSQQEYLQGINLVWNLKTLDSNQEQEKWQNLRKTSEYWHALFPLPYKNMITNWSQQRTLNSLLVTGLIRQESRFEKEILSPVGATGLMQVMPDTGTWIADKIGLAKYSLTNPNDNINLGTWYLDYTHKKYKNNSLLAVASYNAGPGNVDSWVKKYGLNDPDVFVEQIPFKETKGYVESVFGNYWNYLRIYNPEVSRMMSTLLN